MPVAGHTVRRALPLSARLIRLVSKRKSGRQGAQSRPMAPCTAGYDLHLTHPSQLIGRRKYKVW
jgi:hypothetical protein